MSGKTPCDYNCACCWVTTKAKNYPFKKDSSICLGWIFEIAYYDQNIENVFGEKSQIIIFPKEKK